MAQNVYECLFLLDANRYARDPGGVSGSIPKMIENAGGEVLASRLWNEQKLAYPIRGQRKGTYWLTYFRLDSTKLTELNRSCQLNDSVLRNLVLKVEPRLIDALVSHALGKRSKEPEEESAGAAAAAAKSAAPESAGSKSAAPESAGSESAGSKSAESKSAESESAKATQTGGSAESSKTTSSSSPA